MKNYRYLSDGIAAIEIEVLDRTVRFLNAPLVQVPHDKPEFFGAVTWRRWTDTVATLVAASVPGGKLSRRHQALLVRALIAADIRVLYTERKSGVTPLSERVTEGDFKGCWRTDLVAAVQRFERIYPVPPTGVLLSGQAA